MSASHTDSCRGCFQSPTLQPLSLTGARHSSHCHSRHVLPCVFVPGRQSAAFEAVAVKKSYILSPPEIYAECAHHGEEKCGFAWYKMAMLSLLAGCYVGFGGWLRGGGARRGWIKAGQHGPSGDGFAATVCTARPTLSAGRSRYAAGPH
jgi:hypothetical protein